MTFTNFYCVQKFFSEKVLHLLFHTLVICCLQLPMVGGSEKSSPSLLLVYRVDRPPGLVCLVGNEILVSRLEKVSELAPFESR